MVPPILLLCCLAAAPEASISGPSRVAPGTLIVLDAPADPSITTRSWLLMGTDRVPHVCDDGSHCVFAASDPGLYEFIFIGAGVDRAGKATLVVTKHSVTVGVGPAPIPGPAPPDPEPTPPEPSPPPGKYGLDVAITGAMPEIGGPPEKRVEQANVIAKAFRSTASKAAAGAITEVQVMVDETAAKYRTDLGPEAAKAWEPVLGAIRTKLGELGLETIPEHVEAWNEIATTLEATK